MDILDLTVVVGGLVAGYGFVSFLIKNFRGDSNTGPSNERLSSAVQSKTVNEEERYAEVLGFRGPVTISEMKSAYENLMAKYHPSTVAHMGDEFIQLAEEKRREITVAYEYFRKKYRIT
jgi:preprotein translocase subunit Sec63